MSLLNNVQLEPTKEDKQAMVAKRIREYAGQTYQQLLNTQQQGIDMVWDNQMELTPQEVCDSLGVDAVGIFQLHRELTKAVVSIATVDGIVADVALPTNAFTANADGTIAVLDKPYVPA